MLNCLKFVKTIILFLLSSSIAQGSVLKEANSADDSNNKADVSNVFKVKMIDLAANGDCTLISDGSTQILIDCGGANSTSVKNIISAIDEEFSKGEDKCLDYAIFSHGDSDHIYSFACNLYNQSSFIYSNKTNTDSCLACYLREKEISIGTFIDFDYTEDKTLDDVMKSGLFEKETTNDKEESEEVTESKNCYTRYKNARNLLLKGVSGKAPIITDYFTASECLYQFRELDADTLKLRSENQRKTPTDTFQFSSSPKGILKILNNQFCYKQYNEGNSVSSTDKNIIATCVLIEYDGYKYLFTGDLPEFDSVKDYKRTQGEALLVENNYSDLKDGVLFFKAGHHGSMTSNSDYLLNVIKPQYVGISCNAGGQYHFPKDTVIENLGLYTDRIFITSIKIDDNPTPYHGTTTFTYNSNNDYDEKLVVSFNGDIGKESLIEDNEKLWNVSDDKKVDRKNTYSNRRFPIRVIELSSYGLGTCLNDCTYVKMGHYDILINDGSEEDSMSQTGKNQDVLSIEDKIAFLCNDHVLDCLVISTLEQISISRLSILNQYIGKDKPIKKIKKVVINPLSSTDVGEGYKDISKLKKNLISAKNNGLIDEIIGINAQGDFDSLIDAQKVRLNSNGDSYVQVLDGTYNSQRATEHYKNSLGINVHFAACGETFNYVNFGTMGYKGEMLKFEDGLNGEKINAITIPQLKVIGSKYDDVWKKVKTGQNNFVALFNKPFGKRNAENKNLYPLINFRDSTLLDGTTNFYPNKVVSSENFHLLDEDNSSIDVSATFRFPYFDNESVGFRKFCDCKEGQMTYFSNYNLEATKYSDYSKSFADQKNDIYKLLLH